MRGLLRFVWIFLAYGLVHAQPQPLLFGFDEIPLSLMQQPGAAVETDWHLNIPMLSSLGLTAGVSGVSLHELTGSEAEDFNQRFEELVVQGLNKNDLIYLQGQSHVFFAGFRNPRRPSDYYSFGLYANMFFMNYWPEDIADLAYYGNAGPENRGRRYDLDHIKQRGEVMAVWHLGWNRKVDHALYLGARVKLYKEMVHWSSTSNRGYFVTTDGSNNEVRNTLVADFELRTSGVESFRDVYRDGDLNNTETLTRLILDRALLGGNFGFGLDLGFTLFRRPDLRIQGSINDLGVMRHSDGVKNYVLRGASSIEGLQVLLPEDFFGSLDPWQDLLDQVTEEMPFEDNAAPYWSMRPFTAHVGLQRDFGQPRARRKAAVACDCDAPRGKHPLPDYTNSLGGVVSILFAPRGPQPSLSGYYTRRVGRHLSLRATYTANKYSASNLGLGMEGRIGPVQLFITADNLLGYRNLFDSHTQTLLFGLNLRSRQTAQRRRSAFNGW